MCLERPSPAPNHTLDGSDPLVALLPLLIIRTVDGWNRSIEQHSSCSYLQVRTHFIKTIKLYTDMKHVCLRF